MLCKYCKKETHLIDDCPEIICKKCRIVGHPFWKCKNVNKGDKKSLKVSKEIRKTKKTDISDKGRNKRKNDDFIKVRGDYQKISGKNDYKDLQSKTSVNLYRKNILDEMNSNNPYELVGSFENKNETDSNIRTKKSLKNIMTSDVTPNMKSDMKSDVTSDVKSDVKPDVETYANIIISGDNKLSYYLKFKSKLWSELV